MSRFNYQNTYTNNTYSKQGYEQSQPNINRFFTPTRRLSKSKYPINMYSKPIIQNNQQQQQKPQTEQKRSSTPQPILQYQLQVYNNIKKQQQLQQEERKQKKARTLCNLPQAQPQTQMQPLYKKQTTLEEDIQNDESTDASVQNTCDSLNDIQVSSGLLPPIKKGKQYTLVLDLDETLIHTFDMVGEKVNFYTRPFCQEFLQQMNRYYEIVIFTAAMQDYADAIIDNIDPKGFITHRLYRQHMTLFRGNLVKDLSVLGRNLEKTIIIDNLKQNYEAQPQNGYEIKDFFGKKNDRELPDLCILLNKIACENVMDVKTIIPIGKKIIEEQKFSQQRNILQKSLLLQSPSRKNKYNMLNSQSSLDSSESLSPIKERINQYNRLNYNTNALNESLTMQKNISNNNMNKSYQQYSTPQQQPQKQLLTPIKCGGINNQLNYREKLYTPQIGFNSKVMERGTPKISSFLK